MYRPLYTKLTLIISLKLALEPQAHSLLSLLVPYQTTTSRSIETVLPTPPAPLTGWSTLFRPYGTRLDLTSIELKYKDAIAALSDRLGTDRWFLSSSYVFLKQAYGFQLLIYLLKITNCFGRARLCILAYYS